MWIIMALLSALFAAVRRTSEKRLATQLHHFTMGLLVQLLSLPIISIAMLVHGVFLNPFHLNMEFWLSTIIVCVGFYPLNAFLYLQAIKHDELSNVLPIQSLAPVLTLLPAWLTLGEAPRILGVFGVLITVAGLYALGLKGRALHHPLQPFKEQKSSQYMLLAVVLVTIAAILDKVAIQASDAIYYSFVSTVGAVIVLYVAQLLSKAPDMRSYKLPTRELGLIGSLQGASYTTYLLAISLGPIAYVYAIRGSNILIGSLLGILLLQETLTVAKKVSFILVAIGSVLLAFGS